MVKAVRRQLSPIHKHWFMSSFHKSGLQFFSLFSAKLRFLMMKTIFILYVIE